MPPFKERREGSERSELLISVYHDEWRLDITISQKLERKELRAKAKKILRAEAALRSETSVSSVENSQVISKEAESSSSSSSESASSSGTESSTAGIEADTEESVTSEDESERSGETSPDDNENGGKEAAEKTEKWVAVKGQQAAET